MRQEGALWMPAPSSESTQEALRLLDESHRLLLAILLGVVMQIRSLDLERCRLLGQDAPGVEQLQLGASLITVYALMGFQKQAMDVARQEEASGAPADQSDLTLGAASLTIGLIRLMKLLCPQGGPEDVNEEIVQLAEPLD